MPLSPSVKSQILNYLKQPIPQNVNEIVKRSIPVPFFGDIENARVATISLNPSFEEFESDNCLLPKNKKRFVDRDLLGVPDSKTLNGVQATKVYDSLINYFHKNPYTGWFNWLENKVGKKLGVSYYNGTMVHLDIYPWATQKQWKDLDKSELETSLKEYKKSKLLSNILTEKNFDYIYINGASVKNEIKEFLEIKIKNENIKVPEKRKIKGNTQDVELSFSVYNGMLGNTKLIGISANLKGTALTKENLESLLKKAMKK